MWYGDRSSRHCRWCGKAYSATRPIGKDGFCTSGHKQAHYRAYKKYVTRKTDIGSSSAPGPGGKR